jgi:hypothetical protein
MVNEGRWCRSRARAGRLRLVSGAMVAVLRVDPSLVTTEAWVRSRRLRTVLSWPSPTGDCPVIVRSLSPIARRTAELLDPDNLRELSLGHGLRDGPRDSRTGQQDFGPAELGTPFLAGTERCP